uniref:Pyridoxal-dependent decarboxylase domain-containing protein 1 n=2 Tax=Mesocestoides corti TaxID=53468 RepID=A0A5K3F2L7_MESCO
MESELWSLLTQLLTRTLGQSVNSELEKVRAVFPQAGLHLQNIISQLDSLLRFMDEKYRQKLILRILSDISIWVEQIWHYSASGLRICGSYENSDDCIATACRVALQELWYADTGSPGFSSAISDPTKSNATARPVIYLSPAAPPYLRRWLSLNLCCSGLLITILSADENSDLPTISLPHFEKSVQNDLRLGRQPLLLVAYAGAAHLGSSDCLQALVGVCQRHKIWLHVEGLSFLRMALVDSPPTKPNSVTAINSVNLELSRFFGAPRPINLLLMRSSLPESILLYLNVFPPSVATDEADGEQPWFLPRAFPTTCLADALFAWVYFRLQDDSYANRLRHADHLTVYSLEKIQSLQSIEVFPHQNLCLTVASDVEALKSLDGWEANFRKMLLENSSNCPTILFRYVLPSQKSSQVPCTQRNSYPSSSHESILKPGKTRFMSDSSPLDTYEDPFKLPDQRFTNSLNQWLASALQFEQPNLSIKTYLLPNHSLVLRFSLLDSANLMTINDHDIDTFVGNIILNCAIMEATWKERSAFFNMIASTPGLYYHHLPDWAGLGAAFYVPHAYRCLLPDGRALSLVDHQKELSAALLRLPAKAFKYICDINRDIISRLRSQDFAFSSARVNLHGYPSSSNTCRHSSAVFITEALDSLASSLHNATSNNASTPSSPDDNGSCHCEQSPIVHDQLSCLRFGLIMPGTDICEMVQLVLRTANAVEEESNYVDTLSEVVKRGIEEATLYMKDERAKQIKEQGVLRQLPYLDKLINWWSPPVPTQIHGRMLNLSIGELVSTDSLLRKNSPQCEHPPSRNTSESQNSSSLWSWLLPFAGNSSEASGDSNNGAAQT